MAGISQLWLTEKELAMIEDGLVALGQRGAMSSAGQRRYEDLRAKVGAALRPVACTVETGCRPAAEPSLETGEPDWSVKV